MRVPSSLSKEEVEKAKRVIEIRTGKAFVGKIEVEGDEAAAEAAAAEGEEKGEAQGKEEVEATVVEETENYRRTLLKKSPRKLNKEEL